MTETVLVQFNGDVARKDVRFFAGEALSFELHDLPQGASAAITIAEHAHETPIVQSVTQSAIHVLDADELVDVPEGQSCQYNVWLLHEETQKLVQYGSLTQRSTILPENIADLTAALFSADTPPTLLVDGDSVMAHTGFRDLLVSTTGDVALVPSAYNHAIGGHTVIDMLETADDVIAQIVPDNTIVVMGPIGANREANATVEDHRLQIPELFERYTDAGAVVVAVPTLPDGRTSAEDVDPHGNDAYYEELAQIIRDFAATNPSVFAVDVTAFDPVTMKDDRTHPNISHGAAYLASQTAAAIRALVDGNRIDGVANRLGALAGFDGDTPIDTAGVTGIEPTGWQVTRLLGSGDWSVTRAVNGDLVVAIQNAPDKGQLQIRTETALTAAVGEAFDSIFEIEVDPASTGFNGVQVQATDGTLLGGYFDTAVTNPLGGNIYPHAFAVPLESAVTRVASTLRLSVSAGGSATYRVKRAGLFKVVLESTGASTGGDVPTNTALPQIDNSTPLVGDVLTATSGAWDGQPATYVYQWRADGTDISGATAQSYGVTQAEVGSQISVSVIATNGTGDSLPAVSAQTDAVSEPASNTVISWDSQINSPSGDQLAYSDQDRTVAAVASTNGMRHARGVDEISGQIYFEIEATSDINSVGICGTAVDYASGGPNGVSRCYWSSAYVFHSGGSSFMGSGNAVANGDRVQVAVDTNTNQFWLRRSPSDPWNNNAAADPATQTGGFDCSGIATTIHPYVQLKNAGTATARLHGTADRITGTVPAGYQTIG